jgi:hypothetical protein
MANTWNDEAPEPPWVKHLTDAEVVEHFRRNAYSRNVTHEKAGRCVRDMRKRLYRILLDGLEKKGQQK